MDLNWNRLKLKLLESPNYVAIFEKHETQNSSNQYKTVLETIANNVSYILVNKYLRILGTSDFLYENLFDFTSEFKEVFGEEKYIIAHDVFGGLFASEKTIQYFSPDSLKWEDMGVNYEDFINWISHKEINEFYESFLWDGIDEMVTKVGTHEGIFIYPFLWAEECNINTAFKKIVPYRDLLVTNVQNRPLLSNEIYDADS